MAPILGGIAMEKARAGEFLREYGKNTFVVITEAFAIGKVKFSVVNVGKCGEEHRDFYLPIEKFRQLTEEIDSGEFFKKCAVNTQYPTAYKYVSGENGEKHLNIGYGQIGIRIQVQLPTRQSLCAVAPEAFKEMSFRFKVYSGILPVTRGVYGKMAKEFDAGQLERAKHHSPSQPQSTQVSAPIPTVPEKHDGETKLSVLHYLGVRDKFHAYALPNNLQLLVDTSWGLPKIPDGKEIWIRNPEQRGFYIKAMSAEDMNI